MEVEIRLRSTIAAHNATGYEVYWSAQSTNPYLNIARWNGRLGTQNLAQATQGVTIHTGDVLTASIVGTVITAWINGVQKLRYDTASDSLKFSIGNPGIGFYIQGTGGTRLRSTTVSRALRPRTECRHSPLRQTCALFRDEPSQRAFSTRMSRERTRSNDHERWQGWS